MNNYSIIDIMENIITDPKDLQQFKLAVFEDIFKEIENESIIRYIVFGCIFDSLFCEESCI